MKNIILIFLILSYSASLANSNSINLVTNNSSNYKIVISSTASHWDYIASTELQKYIKQISNVSLTIINDSNPIDSLEIVLGKNKHSENINTEQVRDDGFIIKTSVNKIYLIGVKGKGTLNAVYTFLEDYLSCRIYSSKAKVIPKQNSISIPKIDIIENPAFAYRDLHYFEPTHKEFARWHKLVEPDDKKVWGMFVHTFQKFLPPEKYFKTHPEYFALRNGIRVPEQPCLSNPKVLKIVTSELKRRMKENPGAKIWSVSQNDNYSYCQCPECSKIDGQEGSPSGAIINFVNKIANEFPNKIISTLAYQYSRKAPKHIKPKKNVNIMLCTIECYRTHPIADDTSSSGFLNDLIEWSKITNNIFLWNYVVQFTNFISPFPNFQVLQPNIKLFKKYGVKMIFEQGSGNRQASEFEELRSYIISKLLWNPQVNVDSIMYHFLWGYYGKAGKYIHDYIYLMKSEILKSNLSLNIYGSPVDGINNYLTPELMNEYDRLFEQAEASVAYEPEYLKRVKIAYLPLKYAFLEQAKFLRTGKRGLVIQNNEDKFVTNPKINLLLDDFLVDTKNIDDVYLNEKALTPEIYINNYKTMLSKTMINPLALFKPVKFLTTPNWKYPANGEKSLTDGIHADLDYQFNWVGFEGNNMEVIIDLKKTANVKKVSADFLQNSFSWVFLPTQFEVSLSTDGEEFNNVSVVKNIFPVTKEETVSPQYAFMKNFSSEFNNVEARYIKVKAVNMGICPRWHPGYPFKAWIFTDEIVVE